MQSLATYDMHTEHVFLALGSNLGDRNNQLESAIEELQKYAVLVQRSSIYESEPVGFQEQEPFLNMVCHVTTKLLPLELLDTIQRIEIQLGRTKAFRNGPRTIDIDILLYGGHSIHTERLDVPHPRMSKRAFVLLPLTEIAPDVVHPELGKTIQSLSMELTDNHWVRNTRGGDDVPTVG